MTALIGTLDDEQIAVASCVRTDDGQRIVRLRDEANDVYLLDLTPDQADALAAQLTSAALALRGLVAIDGGLA